jgi:hypothetical protein
MCPSNHYLLGTTIRGLVKSMHVVSKRKYFLDELVFHVCISHANLFISRWAMPSPFVCFILAGLMVLHLNLFFSRGSAKQEAMPSPCESQTLPRF